MTDEDPDVRLDPGGGLSAEFRAALYEQPHGDGPEWKEIALCIRDEDARELFGWLRGVRAGVTGSISALQERGVGLRHPRQPALLDQLRGLEFDLWLTHRLEGALAGRDQDGLFPGVTKVPLPLWGVWELYRLLKGGREFIDARDEVHRWAPGRGRPDEVLMEAHSRDRSWMDRVLRAVREALGV